MNHMNGTEGVASHSFRFKYLSINCAFRLSNWRSAFGNLRFFDRHVATFCGVNEVLFWEREKQGSF